MYVIANKHITYCLFVATIVITEKFCKILLNQNRDCPTLVAFAQVTDVDWL